jgi:hypothetical protein
MNFEQHAYLAELIKDAFIRKSFSAEDFTKAKQLLLEKGVSAKESECAVAVIQTCIECSNSTGRQLDLEGGLALMKEQFLVRRAVCPLHGIRTQARWQGKLSDLAQLRGWFCRMDRWYFGYFSVFKFFLPGAREAKVNWLRQQYNAEINDRQFDLGDGQLPSIVAHSFGTYLFIYSGIRS